MNTEHQLAVSHTPAPWKVVTSLTAADYPTSRDIARIDEFTIVSRDHIPEHDSANARLIAAAPELLIRIKQLLPLAKSSGFRCSVLEDARQLIDLVEGRIQKS